VRIKLLILFSLPIFLFAQNLVPNPSFEDTLSNIPCLYFGVGDIDTISTSWTVPTNSSPDLFSLYSPSFCFTNSFTTSGFRVGRQAPRTGSKTVGLMTVFRPLGNSNIREYIQVQLATTLTPGKDYAVSMYASLGDDCQYVVNKFGVLFTSGPVSYPLIDTTIAQLPQVEFNSYLLDSVNWVLLTDTFTASAGLDHIIIGNFADDVNSTPMNINPGAIYEGAYYFLDDISVVELNPILPVTLLSFYAVEENQNVRLNWTTLSELNADKFLIQNSTNGNSWQTIGEVTANGNSQTKIEYQFVEASPHQGQNYYRLKQVDFNGVFEYSKIISVSTTKQLEYDLEILSRSNYIEFSNTSVASQFQLEIYSVDGKLQSQKDIAIENNEKHHYSIEDLLPGVYLIRLSSELGMVSKKFIKR